MFQYSVILPEMPPPDLLLFSLPTVAVSLCTCVAVVTATIGFWRIRAVGPKSDASPSTAPPLKPDPPVGPTELMPPTPVACHVEPPGSPKARFTVCYSADVDEVEVEEEEEGGGGGDSYREVTGSWQVRGLGLESVGSLAISRRGGDLGWYRYQDRTVINGSVVRLWCWRTEPRGLNGAVTECGDRVSGGIP